MWAWRLCIAQAVREAIADDALVSELIDAMLNARAVDFPIATNLLERNFISAAPNRIWLADIT